MKQVQGLIKMAAILVDDIFKRISWKEILYFDSKFYCINSTLIPKNPMENFS